MAVLQMQRISVCALKKDRKKILELLQQSGIVEIEKPNEDKAGFSRTDTAEQRMIFEKNSSVAENAIEILNRYFPEKGSLLSSLAGKKQVHYEEYKSIVDRQSDVVGAARKLVSLDKKISENRAVIQKKETQKETLAPWKNMDVPMNYTGTKKCEAFIGTLPIAVGEKEILEKFADENIPSDVNIIHSDKNLNYVCILVLKNDEKNASDILRQAGFARPASVGTLTPQKRIDRLNQRIEELKAENEKLKEEISGYKKYIDDFKLAADYYIARAQKYEVLGELLQSKKTFVVTGFVPAIRSAELKKELESNLDLVVEISEIGENEEMPIALKNNRFSANFEGVVASYGLPQRKEADPTTVMSICYFVLFGMMLSDAAYGLIMLLACLILVKKFPGMDEGLKKTLNMFKWCGLSTLIWGVLFGGYFGDLIDVIAVNWFGVTLAEGQSVIPALWFVPLNDPMRLLIFSLLLGVIHLYLGLAMKAYNLIKNGKIMDMIWDVISWYVFLTGLIFMLLPSSLFYGMSQMAFPSVLGEIGKYMALVGLVVIVLMSARNRKNFGLRLILGLYDIYGVTGWLSDLLSYSRLLALGLATGVIAQVINQMGSMFGTGVLGTIIFILIFLVGTVLNMGINLLGAYVHTNRLQYVEFFGKFYEGGGRPFSPFKAKTKYVDIKEEMKL